MMEEKRKTLKSALESGILYLQEREIADAGRDAWLLLEHICGIDHSTYYVHSDREMEPEALQKYQELIRKRGEHIPLQQLTGEAWFYGLRFWVNEHVLIPRQDTELLVEEALEHLQGTMRVLDLCTGSGCILTAILTERPECTGVGADLSPEALQVARANGERLEGRASYVESDLFSEISGSFDVIVSNPPYIRTDVIRELMPEVRDHEPLMALDGSSDGLCFYRSITGTASRYLKEGGWLCMEIGFDQGEEVRRLMLEAGYEKVQVRQDLAGLDRVVTGQWRA